MNTKVHATKPPELVRSVSGQTYGIRTWTNVMAIESVVMFLQSGKVLKYTPSVQGAKAYKLYDGPWDTIEKTYNSLMETQHEYEVICIPEPVFPGMKYLEKHFSAILSQI